MPNPFPKFFPFPRFGGKGKKRRLPPPGYGPAHISQFFKIFFQEGITDIPKALSKISVKAHLKNLHTLRQHCQKYMCKYSEFTFARNALPETIPGCAGFILGLPRVF